VVARGAGAFTVLSSTRSRGQEETNMEVGMQFIFQNTHEGMSDAEMFRQEAKIPILAEEVGMDFCLFLEHHFDPIY